MFCHLQVPGMDWKLLPIATGSSSRLDAAVIIFSKCLWNMQHLLYNAPVGWNGVHSVITVSFHVVRLQGLNIKSTHVLVFCICDWDGMYPNSVASYLGVVCL